MPAPVIAGVLDRCVVNEESWGETVWSNDGVVRRRFFPDHFWLARTADVDDGVGLQHQLVSCWPNGGGGQSRRNCGTVCSMLDSVFDLKKQKKQKVICLIQVFTWNHQHNGNATDQVHPHAVHDCGCSGLWRQEEGLIISSNVRISFFFVAFLYYHLAHWY